MTRRCRSCGSANPAWPRHNEARQPASASAATFPPVVEVLAPLSILPHLASVTFLVRDYDEALTYFTECLGFSVLVDTPLTPEKRWVRVAPPGAREAALLLARAATPEQRAAIGKQSGGRVAFFLNTDDFERDYLAMRSRGVKFTEEPRDESYGRVVVFEDLYGNRWDLVQPHER